MRHQGGNRGSIFGYYQFMIKLSSNVPLLLPFTTDTMKSKEKTNFPFKRNTLCLHNKQKKNKKNKTSTVLSTKIIREHSLTQKRHRFFSFFFFRFFLNRLSFGHYI